MISIDDLKKIELRIGKIVSAERVEGSEKLIKLAVDLGEKNEAGASALRQILAGIGKRYEPAILVGKEIVVVANLEPRKLMGLESQGMLLAATEDAALPVILTVERDVAPGTSVG
jgi:methionine--tRNA ligase beta chain